MELTIKNKEEMIELASFIGSKLQKGDVVLLNGDLGAGKTFFTSYLAKALGIDEHVTSPTFTIVKEYTGDVDLFHIDAYRLEDTSEDVSYIYDYYANGVTVIEWPEFIVDYLPYSYIQLYITNIGESERKIEISFANLSRLQKEVEAYEGN